MNRNFAAAVVLILAASVAGPATAQMDHANCPMNPASKKTETAAVKSPYTDRTNLEIKALTPDAIEQYRTGKGMGLAMPAELNGYPGPRHVLDLAGEMELTAEQRAGMEKLYENMRAEAVRLGTEIVDLETRLDRAFATGTITRAELDKLTSEIAQRQGRLRFAHLETHIAAKALLSKPQIVAYNKARGY